MKNIIKNIDNPISQKLEQYNKWKQKRQRIKYKKLFKKKFQKQVNLSVEKLDDDFYGEYLKEIEKEYRKRILEKSNNGDAEYLIREKIIIDNNIKNLERSDFSYKSVTAIVSSILLLFTFGIGEILDNTTNSVKNSIDNSLKSITDPKIIQQLNSNFINYSNNISDLVLKIVVTMIIAVAISITFVDQISDYKRNKCNRKISFNRMCLDILNKIE
jgi:hypothetical protein